MQIGYFPPSNSCIFFFILKPLGCCVCEKSTLTRRFPSASVTTSGRRWVCVRECAATCRPSVRHTDAGVAMVTVTSPSAAASRSAFPPPAAPLTIALTPQKPNVSPPPHRQGASTLDLYTPARPPADLCVRLNRAHQDFRVTHRDRLPFRRGRCAKDAPQTTDRGKSRRSPAFRRIDPFKYLFEACNFVETF
jgi:hypothetical protein